MFSHLKLWIAVATHNFTSIKNIVLAQSSKVTDQPWQQLLCTAEQSLWSKKNADYVDDGD